MKKIRLLLVILLAAIVISACAREIVNKPQKGFDLHVDAKHYVKNERVDVHHWCKTINDKLIECLLFDSDSNNANLVGIETIIPKDVWNTLSEEQKKEWHDHATEIFEAEATLPDTPKEEADKLVEFLKGTRGRVIYIWDFPKEKVPASRPFLDSERQNEKEK